MSLHFFRRLHDHKHIFVEVSMCHYVQPHQCCISGVEEIWVGLAESKTGDDDEVDNSVQPFFFLFSKNRQKTNCGPRPRSYVTAEGERGRLFSKLQFRTASGLGIEHTSLHVSGIELREVFGSDAFKFSRRTCSKARYCEELHPCWWNGCQTDQKKTSHFF